MQRRVSPTACLAVPSRVEVSGDVCVATHPSASTYTGVNVIPSRMGMSVVACGKQRNQSFTESAELDEKIMFEMGFEQSKSPS